MEEKKKKNAGKKYHQLLVVVQEIKLSLSYMGGLGWMACQVGQSVSMYCTYVGTVPCGGRRLGVQISRRVEDRGSSRVKVNLATYLPSAVF